MEALTQEQLIQKLEAYCVYQERCLFEIQKKLASLNASDEDSDFVIKHLSKNRFFDQKRFALGFAQGKLRINKWGRSKIKAALIQKFVEGKLITEALNSIEDNEYFDVLNKLFERKLKELATEKNEWVKKQKLFRFLISKGFQLDEISEIMTNKLG
jgi:regulatory protein